MSLHIRILSGADELQSVLQQRRQVYADELGYPMPGPGADGTLPSEPLDGNGVHFGAFDGGTLVGSVRVNYGSELLGADPHAVGSHGLGDYAAFYGMQRFGAAFPRGISIVTRLVALRSHRSGQTMAQFGMALYEHTRDTRPDIRLCLIDCVPPLEPMFMRIGYRRIGAPLQHPLAGTVLPMAFAVYHRQHFERAGSPLAAVCPRHDEADATWFDGLLATMLHPARHTLTA